MTNWIAHSVRASAPSARDGRGRAIALALACVVCVVAAITVMAQTISPEDDAITRAAKSGDLRGAIAIIDNKLRFTHDREQCIWLLFRKGEYATSMRDYAVALNAYGSVITLCKNARQDDALLAKMYQAEVYGRWKKYGDARRLYQEVVRDAAQTSLMYQQTAQARIGTLDMLEAKLAIVARATDTAQKARLTFDIAEFYSDLKDFDAAIREYKNFILANPNHERSAEAQFQIGRVFAQKDDAEHAVEAYRWVVERYPASTYDAPALFQLGKLYLASGDSNRALDALTTLVTDRPTFWMAAEACYLQAVAYERTGRVQEAVDAYRYFLDLVLT
ncbi:MAG: tetratricopeptide repeat protein, partial [Candidatus Poribacteria bacterium]|nr:tetratricopeptide repeat protein [Candidatus Poribacteria bacterium]